MDAWLLFRVVSRWRCHDGRGLMDTTTLASNILQHNAFEADADICFRAVLNRKKSLLRHRTFIDS